MENLDYLLAFLEENLDEQHVRRVEQLHMDAMAYKSVPFLPLSLIYTDHDFNQYPKEEAMETPAKMMFNELLSTIGGCGTYSSVKLKDHFPPQIRSNHGIGILASLFGAECKIINNNMPWVEPLDPDQLKKAVSHGVPSFNQGLGLKVMDTHRFFIEKLKSYPKCSRCIRITQPDLQGPFDIAHILAGEAVFYDLYDDPDFLHELLQIITETYIGFRKSLEPLLTDHAGDGAVYLHGCIFGGRVLIKDDTAATNLSEEMYRAFSKKYNDEIFEAFGGGSLHYCGKSRPWHLESMNGPWLKGINYGNPEMQDLRSIHEFWRARGIPNLLWGDVLCGYRQSLDFLQEIHDLGIRTGMSLTIRTGDFEEALSILERHSCLT